MRPRAPSRSWLALGLLALVVTAGPPREPRRDGAAAAGDPIVYLGSGYPGMPGPASIHVLRLDAASGELSLLQSLPAGRSPSFFEVDASTRTLYVNLESSPSGAAAYAIDPQDGTLALRNAVHGGGDRAAYLSLDPSGRFLLQAHYESHSVSVTTLREDGSLGDVVRTEWLGDRAYPHCVRTDPTGRFVFVLNRTWSTVSRYRFDPTTGTLGLETATAVSGRGRIGPRHLVFHPNGRTAWVANESISTLSAFAFEPGTGALVQVDEDPTIPAAGASFDVPNHPADLRLDPSGRFLYVANRGHGSIAIFRVDGASGRSRLVGRAALAGSGPRNLGIDPAGRFLVVGELDADVVQVFRIDGRTGALRPLGEPLAVHAPSGIAVVTLPRRERPVAATLLRGQQRAAARR